MKTKPFNLEEALANPDKVVCRDGVKPSDLHYFKQVEEWRFTRPSSADIYATRNDGRYCNETFHYYDLLLRCETKIVPFTRPTFFPHRDKWMKNKDDLLIKSLTIGKAGLVYIDVVGSTRVILFDALLEQFTFEDGTPCGREVEE